MGADLAGVCAPETGLASLPASSRVIRHRPSREELLLSSRDSARARPREGLRRLLSVTLR